MDLCDCLSSTDLAGLIDKSKEQPIRGLADMFATGYYSTDKEKVEFDVIGDGLQVGMIPAVKKCHDAPDLPDEGFYTQEYRPASYAIDSQINNCDRCPPRVPLEREYSSLPQAQKINAWRLNHLRYHDDMIENRWEYDVACLIQDSEFWVRYQDENGKPVGDPHLLAYDRDPALNGTTVGTSWSEPLSNIVCDMDEMLNIHGEIACNPVRKMILGANVYKCIQRHRQFDICDDACASDIQRSPNFLTPTPCDHNYEGMQKFAEYCGVEYWKHNGKMKMADGSLEYLLDPDCVYTFAPHPRYAPVTRMYSKFQTLMNGPVETDIWRREFFQDRPQTLEIESRYCGLPGMLCENRFAKWRVKY